MVPGRTTAHRPPAAPAAAQSSGTASRAAAAGRPRRRPGCGHRSRPVTAARLPAVQPKAGAYSATDRAAPDDPSARLPGSCACRRGIPARPIRRLQHRSCRDLLQREAEITGFCSWREGLVIRPELAGSITGVADLRRVGLRVVNTEPGTEERRVLDEELVDRGIEPCQLAGYATRATAPAPEVQGLLKVLSSPWLIDQLASLPGYDPSHCGEHFT
jgi:hypothetical protein